MSKVNVPIALLSVVISVLLWASVYNNTNKKIDKKDVFVSLQPGNLDQKKYVITEIPSQVKITLAGNNDQLKTASPYAIVDLSMPETGVKAYPVVIFPASVRELVLSFGVTAQIKIEALDSKPFEIKGIHTGVSPDGKQVESLEIFPRRVFITGPKALVAKVANVQVLVDYSTAAASTEGIGLEAKAVDASGIEVPGLILRASDTHPEYTDDAVKEPFTVRAYLKMAADPVDNKPNLKIP